MQFIKYLNIKRTKLEELQEMLKIEMSFRKNLI